MSSIYSKRSSPFKPIDEIKSEYQNKCTELNNLRNSLQQTYNEAIKKLDKIQSSSPAKKTSQPSPISNSPRTKNLFPKIYPIQLSSINDSPSEKFAKKWGYKIEEEKPLEHITIEIPRERLTESPIVSPTSTNSRSVLETPKKSSANSSREYPQTSSFDIHPKLSSESYDDSLEQQPAFQQSGIGQSQSAESNSHRRSHPTTFTGDDIPVPSLDNESSQQNQDQTYEYEYEVDNNENNTTPQLQKQQITKNSFTIDFSNESEHLSLPDTNTESFGEEEDTEQPKTTEENSQISNEQKTTEKDENNEDSIIPQQQNMASDFSFDEKENEEEDFVKQQEQTKSDILPDTKSNITDNEEENPEEEDIFTSDLNFDTKSNIIDQPEGKATSDAKLGSKSNVSDQKQEINPTNEENESDPDIFSFYEEEEETNKQEIEQKQSPNASSMSLPSSIN
ncbi:hypothetical protein TVAG_468190 [Trichomonas vaginalis G3]|uniref:Uncharacterized protein n=1 Tax=Trichomonas vaginalis (strain ATCC PRA-98 / G3) TaxID=412133 RepID=A2E0Q8_TRIV3|nr:hypothetical protein TVAGG3_0073600 [Trichomonas vaginalis G3]EAY13803.1 hypothetical protein TVAG_468190 [Trichomonas vaginalis G3]KAI5542682.1 hypothetical protein TVAGG3_0073600 [Trichomonas vaginalis G3]|eukprot:XP_001326026.1 hypothetical protein [Trichomonas vaginalis G3]